MRRLVARLARAITRRRPIPEPVCWCGIHHLGVGYVHERPTTAWYWIPEVADPTKPTRAELDAGIRIDGITHLED